MLVHETRTERGLRHFQNAFLAYIIALAALLIIFIIILARFAFGDTNGEVMFVFMVGTFFGIIFTLIAIVYFYMGIDNIHQGRFEFGMLHARSVEKGRSFIFIGFVIIVLGFFIGGSFFSVIGVILIALGFKQLIYDISDERGKRTLWAAMITFIMINIISLVVSVVLLIFIIFDQGFFIGGGFGGLMMILILPYAMGSLAIIPVIMFLFAYRDVYYRIQNGELKPQPVMFPPPFFPGYPPPYPPPAYPYYPPMGFQGYPQQPGYAYPYGNVKIGIKPPKQGATQEGVSPAVSRTCRFCGGVVPQETRVCPTCGRET